MINRVDVYGVGFDNLSLEEAVDTACKLVDTEGNHMVVTPNSEIVYMTKDDPNLGDVLNGASLVVPDGIGVVKAAKILKTPLKEKVAGIELGEKLIERMSKSGKSVYFLGAKPGIAQLAGENMAKKYPGLNVAGAHDGYFKDDAEVVEDINASGAQVLFVCLGAPKQEYWMHKNLSKINTNLMLGLGGSLDIFAGQSKRAPDIFIKLGLEWFYRLIKEPWRFGRMMALPKFILAVRKYARKNK